MINKKKRAIVIACIIVCLAWGIRYYTLNQHFAKISDNKKQIYTQNQTVEFGEDYLNKGLQSQGYTIRVDNFQIQSYEEFREDTSFFSEDERNQPDNIALVTVTIKNENSNAEGVMLTELKLHGIDNYVGMNMNVFPFMNPNLSGSFGIHLKEGNEYTVILPYNLMKDQFGRDTWKHLDKYRFYLHITSYPVEKDIILQ